MASPKHQKIVVVGAGPVGSLAALYAATRGDDVEIYELRGGKKNFYYLAIQESVAAPAALFYLRRRFCHSRIYFRELCRTWHCPSCQAIAPECRSPAKTFLNKEYIAL
jgi:2-polyprenyl-6-methoxyphenol hydroxylase-like FAD-dependent oxidoreductase